MMAAKVLQYGELAKYYDLIYDKKDYAKESRILLNLINRYKRSDGRSLLDVGCGTGKHIERLKGKFDCVGIDINEEMLEQARVKVKGVEFIRADMSDFDLGRKFDVVLCLFGAIGYVKTYSRLARTLQSFANHLKDGGVLIIEPWLTKAISRSGLVHLRTYDSPDLKIARVNITDVRGNISILDFRIIVAEKDGKVAYYRDVHRLGLFEQDKLLQLMREAGLESRHMKKSLSPGRGLYIGMRESAGLPSG